MQRRLAPRADKTMKPEEKGMTDTDFSPGAALTDRSGGNGQSGGTSFWRKLKTIIGGRSSSESLRDAIEGLIEETGEAGDGSMPDHERVLISNILELRDLTAEDVMVPRADIIAVPITATQDELLTIIAERGHSRLPVYRDSLDDVAGLVHIKDIVGRLAIKKPFQLDELLRDVLIIAPSMRVLDLLMDMRRGRRQLALVVDEFGGIDGLVTIEDLVEGIVGEIEDEFDRAISPSLEVRADGSVSADARVSISDFETRFGPLFTQEERDEIDTLGGLVFSIAGRVPSRGELLTHSSGLEFEVVEADPRRIRRLRIRNAPTAAE